MSNIEGSPNKANDYFLRLEVDGEEGGEYIDHWDTGELLFLASSVQRSDRNWVSVARGLKLYGEQTRPADFYTPKNCALQYTRLLSEVDEDSKKKTLPRTERETSEAMLVKNLTDKRLAELAWLNQQTKATANMLKSYADMVENGELDDQLDDLIKNIDEKEKREEEKYVEYLSKRENLISTKKLNKSRLAKGKASKVDKKKSFPFADVPEETLSKDTIAEVVKNIKKEIEEETLVAASAARNIKRIKTEYDTNISLNALLDTKVTMPASVSPTSPLLTSLLRTITSSSPVSQQLTPVSNSPLKEGEYNEGDHIKIGFEITPFPKSKETSPRGVPQSPRPTPSSSPLLNSLLKNSPSSSTIASKDVSPKAVSSPQPFFTPSNVVLVSASPQQLAAATSTQSLSHQFFPQEASESRKTPFQTSPITSACLAAPTLSKLLEMPPSTPGRLPPLPVLDPPIIPTFASPQKTISQLQNEVKPTLSEISPTKEAVNKTPTFIQPVSEAVISVTTSSNISEKLLVGSDTDSKKTALSDAKLNIVIKSEPVTPNTSPTKQISENIKIEEVQEEVMETSLDQTDQESPKFALIDTDPCINIKNDDVFVTESSAVVEIKLEKMDDLPKPDLNISESEIKESKVDEAKVKTSEELDDKESSHKPFKGKASKKPSGAEEILKAKDTSPLLTPAQIKKEPETSPKKIAHVKIEVQSPVKTKSDEGICDKILEQKSEQEDNVQSPVSKTPKLSENVASDKQSVSEDEAPSSIRRSGRKAKKSRGRGSKPPPAEPIEPKDHYEFTESADESSAIFPASNMLRYGSRLKETSRSEEKNKILNQESEDTPVSSGNDLPSVDKKSPLKSKPGGGKSLFGTDEDMISDSISDDTSNSALTEDKLKKWEESNDKQIDTEKSSGSVKVIPKASKMSEQSKKKSTKRALSTSNSETTNKKTRKLTGSDFDELSAGSRDSEDASSSWKQEKESSDKKNQKTININESKTETVDNHMSSSVAAESEPMDDAESLQGSVSAEFSPLPASEVKDTSQFGKQDWFQGVSPKSSEHVSQSSEESEYESDNWDSHSVSTNKSASHSSDPQPRSKRKERETPQYKAWKKAIHIVLREASCHKYANVFLQKVTNDVAPGYSSIVYRPMDLSLIKKNIDNGVIRTTEQFHRDMLLMFQNAIMYNSSDHDVYKMAVEMQRDVMQQIMAFLTTQYNDKDEHNEPTSSLRGARGSKSQKGAGKQSTSSSTKTKDDVERD